MTGLSLAKATGGSWLKKWKATVTPDPNRPLRGNGSELDSPRDMFLGLSLRFKSDLRNSGRIYLTAVRKETSLPLLIHHQNREILMMINFLKFTGFGPPPWWGGSTLRVELRGKTRRQVVVRIRNALLNIIIAIIPQIEF